MSSITENKALVSNFLSLQTGTAQPRQPPVAIALPVVCDHFLAEASYRPSLSLFLFLPFQIYVQDGVGAELRLRVASSAECPILDPQMAPDGSAIAFVRSDELHVVSATTGEVRQLTFGGKSSGKVVQRRHSLFVICVAEYETA